MADRITVPRQPGDSDQRAAAREWIADERQAGRQPTAGDVTRKHRINYNAAGEMLAAQNRAEEAVGAPAVAGERAADGQTPTATTERLPVTPEGKQAKLTLARLAALRAKGVDLNGGHRTAQREAELTLARDLNDQVLTNPQPTTPAGKAALARIEAWEPKQAEFNPGQLLSLHGEHMRLEQDFTQQRLAIEAKGGVSGAARPLAVGDQAKFGNQLLTVAELPAASDKAVALRTPSGNLQRFNRKDVMARRVDRQSPPDRVAPGDSFLPKTGPIKPEIAARAADAQIKANLPMLKALGVEKVSYGPTAAASGLELSGDGTLRINVPKLAQSMEIVRDNQAKLGIEGTAESWVAQVMVHEGIHAADFAVAKAKGQTIKDRYDALPTAAMPEGWTVAGRDVYGANEWDALPEWKQKAEFVRQVVEGKWSGRLTEALYKFITDAITYLKRVAGFEDAHPAFKTHVQEVEARIQAMRTNDSPTPLKPKAPRAFTMPHAPTGLPDVLDHIVEQGGIVSPSKAKARPGYSKTVGDYDSAPTLGGFYHRAVFGGAMMPDQMAEILHNEYGVGDGSTDGMWKAIASAKELRTTVRAERSRQETVEKQAVRFDKDAMQPGTAKGKTEVNTANLSVGDQIAVGDQTLKVTDIDPDTLDLTLEDHSKYGVQRIADGETLYVEKVEPGNPGSLGAARPSRQDTRTSNPFADDAPFTLRGEAASHAERMADTREVAKRENLPVSSAEPFTLPTEGGRIVAPGQPGESAARTAAREWIASERAEGRNPTAGDVTRKFRINYKASGEFLADQDRVDKEAGDLDALGAAAPAPASGSAGIIDSLKAKAGAAIQKNAADDHISASFDSAETRAGIAGDQAANSIRLDFPKELDRQAALAVAEAGGRRFVLTSALAQVTASTNPKLAAKYAPIYQHALDNLDRLQAGLENFRQIDLHEDNAAEAAGLPPEWQKRMKHMWDDPLSPESTVVTNHGFRLNPGYKTNADAIEAGVAPKSADLADAVARRVTNGRRILNAKAFQDELFSLKAADGKPILSDVVETSERLNEDGSKSATQKVPKGYVAVQAGDQLLTVHQDYADLFKALYEPSAVRASAVGRTLLKGAAIAKSYTLVFDTFHVGRLAFKEAAGAQEFGYGKGLSVLEYSDADLARQVKDGNVDQAVADWARRVRPKVDELLAAGLNVGKMADNLAEATHTHIPGLEKVNDWIFKKFSRGAMMQVGLTFLDRNAKRFPEMSRADVVRRSAKEANEFMGNLGHQGWLKSKTMQDVARLAFLAPNWTESQFRTEMRGIGQAGRAASDAMRGKGVRVGNLAQGMATGILGLVIANQIINLLTRGKPTWENEEEGRKFSAWLPGGPQNRGYWFSPLELAAEFTHAGAKYVEHGEGAVDAATHIASNKLSPLARGAKDLITGRDYAGRPFRSMRERLTAALVDALPSPMPLGAFLEKDPKSALGYRYNRQPGSGEKQLLSSAGLKVEAEPSARSKMYGIAERFRPHANTAPHPASEYADLRKLLDAQDRTGVRSEIQRLMDGGKPLATIGRAVGLRDGGKVAPELFTGSKAGEEKMIPKLSKAELKTWVQAQRDRQANAKLFAEIAAGVRAQLNRDDSGKAQALAAVAKKQGNPGLAHTLTRTGAITAPGRPAPDPLGTGQGKTFVPRPAQPTSRDPLRPAAAEDLQRRAATK